MVLLARALVRLVSFVLLVVLALAGLVLAIFCISTGTSGASLGGLARLLHLSDLRDTVGAWLSQLAAPGPVAVTAALCGLGAILLGLLLLVGILVPRRERLLRLAGDERGTVAARRRPLAQAATSLAEQVRGVTDARARVRPRRRAGGRLSVRASRSSHGDSAQLQSAVRDQLTGLTEPFALTARVEIRQARARTE
jgi:hypothetical protein